MKKKVAVIGAGFSGLSAAAYLAKWGYDVTLFEKHDQCGGRARVLKDKGYVFDMGPSWYWMNDVFERFFNDFGYTTSDWYTLVRLNPSYRVFFNDHDIWDIPADLNELYSFFESIEEGSAKQLKKFLEESKFKYDIGINKLVYKPGKSFLEFMDLKLFLGIVKFNVFNSISDYIRKLFKDKRLIQILEFPVLFLGAKPDKIPALYSLMNYADLVLGTWYPMGGMHQIVLAMEQIASKHGVEIKKMHPVDKILVKNNKAKGLLVNEELFDADVFVASSDYHFTDSHLIPEGYRNYTESYWEKVTMAPSCLIYYLGISKKLKNLRHHNLFFDQDFQLHASEIYDTPRWPSNPLFYVSCPSLTDPTVAPNGKENLFILIPVASGLKDDLEVQEKYFSIVIERLEKLTDQDIKNHIEFKKNYAYSNFIQDYNAFKGNAYGLANTLSQTAILKPKIKNKHLKNFYYTGQLTVPGPGVPPAIISGKVVAKEIFKEHKI